MKTKFTIVLLFFGVIFLQGNGQSIVVCEGDVTLSSQAEVNAFQCTEITGRLWIQGTDITDLSPLQGLTKVGGLIITESNSLTNVDGLSGLREITSFSGTPYVIGIAGNASLKNLDGLSSITSDTIGPISISNNPSLETINGFSSVKTVFGLFSVANNPALKSMNGFKNITTLTDWGFQPYLLIDNNPSLINLDGFSSLEALSGHGANLQISNNTKLNNINGLSSLAYISGGGRGTGLFIENNPALLHIDGLKSLTHLGAIVGTALNVKNNTSLKNLDGLSNVKVARENFSLEVTKNSSLKDCGGLFPLMVRYGLDYVSSNNFKISENGSGCTLQDIIANGPPAILGFSIYDKRTGSKVMDFFDDNIFLDMANPDYRYWILQANTQPGKVGSVLLEIDSANARIDNQTPFQFEFQSLAPGIHTIMAEAYSKPNKLGVKGISGSAYLRIQNSAEVVSFDAVDTSGKVLKTLKEGDVINISDPAFKSFTILANVYPEHLHHVTFWINGTRHRADNMAPYSLNGDSNGNFVPWNPKPGSYTLRGVPYAKTAEKELPGKSLQIRFKIIADPVNGNSVNASSVQAQSSDLAVSLYPVPVKDDLFLELGNGTLGKVSVVLRNNQGHPVYTGSHNSQQFSTHTIKTSGLPSGIYYLQLRGANGFEKVIRVVK